jgi:BASS family bile acid:Na+ symporter
MKPIIQLANKVTSNFTALVLILAIAGFLVPGLFISLKDSIPLLLGMIMFGMGMSLQPTDFKIAFTRPLPIAIGVLLQFLLMPATGYLIAHVFNMPVEIAVGLVLVGASPGGTASNVMVYLARGNVALSIAMTAVSTLLAPLLTPWLTLLYAGKWMAVDPLPLFYSILKIVLLPVIAGTVLNRYFPNHIARIAPVMPAVSVVAIIFIIACVVALNAANLLAIGFVVLLAVMLHNIIGFTLGYWLAALAGLNKSDRRTIAIEVGMQNSGLAAALAHSHFSAAAALPAAVFSVWHNISGSFLATRWSRDTD